jgi:hypothetical protein
MNMSEIVKDSLSYPFYDWKKILIFGILILITGIDSIVALFGVKDYLVLSILFIVGYFIFGFLIRGYQLRIIETSLEDVNELPEFKNWIGLFVGGIKLSIVCIVYSIPAILILAFGLFLGLSSGNLISNSSPTMPAMLKVGFIFAFLAFLYMLIIAPIIATAIAHMANNNTKIAAAFRFHEIFDKIRSIGWGNLLVWYIVTGIIYLMITVVGTIISVIFATINPILGIVVVSLSLIPYLYMYIGRSIGLLYVSK